MFKKAMNKVRKYADGGNVTSGSPQYGFNQMNPVMGGGAGGAYPNPNVPAVAQNRFASANPPAFNNAAPPAAGPLAARPTPFKKGGKVKAKSKKSSASRRGDGIASKGKTKGRFV